VRTRIRIHSEEHSSDGRQKSSVQLWSVSQRTTEAEEVADS
jgi:hypothetical protein